MAKVREIAKNEHSEVFVICAQIEQEIAELDDDEKKMFLEDLGLEESGLEKLIKASYSLLGLISYLTAGETETRAWTIIKGTKAPGAAGKIHSDFERGFIRAEVVNYQDLLDCGSLAAADIGLVMIVIIVASGSLAFVVLYNLININVSERIREISTIKVLGFYDNEVRVTFITLSLSISADDNLSSSLILEVKFNN